MLQVVDQYLVRISENRLLDEPGMQPLRKELLETARGFYQRFVEKHRDDMVFRAERARALQRLANISLILGNPAESSKLYLEALPIQQELVAEDPKNPENPLSYAYSQKIDETEQFPHEAIHWLYDRELAQHYVPKELGGSFHSFAELADVIRVLSRRDVSSAVAFSTLFWSFLAWVGGTDEQKRWLAKYIM